MADDLASFLYAIKMQESGGDYSVVQSGTGALGAYQVLPSNLPGWLQQAGLPAMSPQQYLANPAAQDQLAAAILGGYYQQYGAAGAAAAWYSGDPGLAASTSPQAYGPSIQDYVNQVLQRMNVAPAGLSIPNPLAPHSPLDIPGAGDIAGSIGKGLANGILDAIKGLLAPVFKWAIWGGETIVGVALIAGGAYMALKGPGASAPRAGAPIEDEVPKLKAPLEYEQSSKQKEQRRALGKEKSPRAIAPASKPATAKKPRKVTEKSATRANEKRTKTFDPNAGLPLQNLKGFK